MKKVFIGLFLLVVAASLFAAAPVWKERVKVAGDVVADSQWTAAAWEAIGNIIWVSTDSSYQIITISGTALLDPGEKLYLGASDDSAGAGGVPIYDTSIVGVPKGLTGRSYVPFTFIYRDSQITQTDITDTTFFWMASQSLSSKVDVLGLTIQVTVTELNAAND